MDQLELYGLMNASCKKREADPLMRACFYRYSGGDTAVVVWF
jgi:hypothetical protein